MLWPAVHELFSKTTFSLKYSYRDVKELEMINAVLQQQKHVLKNDIPIDSEAS